MTEEKPQVKAVEIMEQPPAGMPPSPNPHLAEQLVQAVQSGDPNKALDALVAAGTISPGLAANMKDNAEAEKRHLMILANQVGKAIEAIRTLGYLTEEALKGFERGVHNEMNAMRADIDLIRRALKRVPAFADELDKLEIDRQNRAEVAAKAAAKVKAGSAGSAQVTTSKAPPKVA